MRTPASIAAHPSSLGARLVFEHGVALDTARDGR